MAGQARKVRLPTAAFLLLWWILECPVCPVCERAVEFTLHALIDCKLVTETWKLLLDVQYQQQFLWYADGRDWIDSKMRASHLEIE